jgi:isoleucyl-tRNA synthetase
LHQVGAARPLGAAPRPGPPQLLPHQQRLLTIAAADKSGKQQQQKQQNNNNGNNKPAGAGAEKKKKDKEESVYSPTVRLPETAFDMRANSTVKEPLLQQFWREHKVYETLAASNKGDPFTLHDGPPYANGDLHIGHALNKVLKDFINKYQLLQGRKARFVPGWDCHGLPIELKVLQGMKEEERKALTPLKLRQEAAAFAKRTVESQRDQFKRYGVWADWEAPYLTLQPEYEAAQIEVFGKMVLNGHIYR